ncbi:MAG: hypothetical protein WCO29_05575 [Nostocales cyanobacterium ELA583]
MQILSERKMLQRVVTLMRTAYYSSMHLNEIHHNPPPRLREGSWGWGSCILLNREPL